MKLKKALRQLGAEKSQQHACEISTRLGLDWKNEISHIFKVILENHDRIPSNIGSAIRIGTNIHKWYRIKSQKIAYMWNDLNNLCKTNHLNEAEFENFIRKTLSLNPDCLAIETSNP